MEEPYHHIVEMRKVGDKTLPFLNKIGLQSGQNIEVVFPDGFIQTGKVLIDNSCNANDYRPFMAIEHHGKRPWVYLVNMKVRRI